MVRPRRLTTLCGFLVTVFMVALTANGVAVRADAQSGSAASHTAPSAKAVLPTFPMESCPSIPGKPSSPGAICGSSSAAGLQVLKPGYPQPSSGMTFAPCPSIPGKHPSSPNALCGTPKGATSATTTATTSTTSFTISLSASYSLLGVNESDTLTATTNQNVGPTPWYIEIFNQNTNVLVAICGSGTSCSVSVTQSNPENYSYIAYVAASSSTNPPPNIQATSGTVSVQWVYFSVSLTSSFTTQSVGQSVTLTAVSNYNVGPSPYWIEIFNETTNVLVATCGSGTSCSASVSQSNPESYSYIAYVAASSSTNPPPTIQATSGTVSVQWVYFSVSLTSDYTTQLAGQSVTLTAVSNYNVGPSPYWIEIFNETTNGLVAICGSGTGCPVSLTQSSAESYSYIAYVAASSSTNPPPTIQATSGTVSVNWVNFFSATLSASTTSPSGGGSVTMTASANIQGNSPYDIEIYNSGSDALLSACSSGSTCTASVSEAGGVTESYIAYVADYSSTAPPPNIQATSNTVLVAWTSATGGFSAGSWDGTPSPASAYHYGIVDAGGGFTGSSADCSYPSDADTSFSGALSALQKDNMPAYGFMFVTSWYWYQHNCSGGSITSAAGWGEAQAQYFDEALTASGYTGTLNRIFADVETGIGADWQDDTKADNQAVIYGFNYQLCTQYGLCSRGIYSGRYAWPLIVGTGDPNVDTSHFWLAAWDPTQSNLNKFEDYFTTSPGGYTISSWQYGTTACTMTYAAAQTEANDASPWIPRFDMWTNSHPNVVC